MTTTTTTEIPTSPACYTEDSACKLDQDNLISEPKTDVNNLKNCSDYCLNEDGCNFFTYYPDIMDNPITKECHLFRKITANYLFMKIIIQ